MADGGLRDKRTCSGNRIHTPLGLIVSDAICLLQGQSNIIETIKQAFSPKPVELEADLQLALVTNRALLQVNSQLQVGLLPRQLKQLADGCFIQREG